MSKAWYQGPVFRVASVLLGTYGALVVVVLLIDIGYAVTDPKTYQALYGMSVQDYLLRVLPTTLLATILPVVAVLSFADPERRRFWSIAVVVAWIAVILVLVVRYAAWAERGFDHGGLWTAVGEESSVGPVGLAVAGIGAATNRRIVGLPETGDG